MTVTDRGGFVQDNLENLESMSETLRGDGLLKDVAMESGTSLGAPDHSPTTL